MDNCFYHEFSKIIAVLHEIHNFTTKSNILIVITTNTGMFEGGAKGLPRYMLAGLCVRSLILCWLHWCFIYLFHLCSTIYLILNRWRRVFWRVDGVLRNLESNTVLAQWNVSHFVCDVGAFNLPCNHGPCQKRLHIIGTEKTFYSFTVLGPTNVKNLSNIRDCWMLRDCWEFVAY